MTSVRAAAIASIAVALGVHPLFAQGLSRYREYTLESNIASVVAMSGTRADNTKTLHERPARIQELEWRTAYVSPGTEMADPVRGVLFSFFDDQLYQIVVAYDRDRMEGLTNDDVIESVSATYGLPLLRHARAATTAAPVVTLTDTTVVAQWEDAGAVITLTRGSYSPQFHLTLNSKALTPRAQAAITEALRLDAVEAPQRDLDKRNKEIAKAGLASQKARVANKAAFKP